MTRRRTAARGLIALVLLGPVGCTRDTSESADPGDGTPAPSVRPPPQTPNPPVDVFGLAERCPWYRDDLLNMGWTFYLRSADDELFYIGMHPRRVDPSGGVRGLVFVRQIRGAREHRFWLQTFPIQSAKVSAGGREVRIGASYFRAAGQGSPHRVHLEITSTDGKQLTLDAQIQQRVATWHEEGVVLAHDAGQRIHFEYVMLCPRGELTGTLWADEGERPVRGVAYFDSIRWLSTAVPEARTWNWGFLHSGPYSLLLFEPANPGATGLFILYRDSEPMVRIRQENWPGSEGLRGPRRLRYSIPDGDPPVRLTVDVSAFEPRQNQTLLVPYEIEIGEGAEGYRDRGRMAFELGHWDRL